MRKKPSQAALSAKFFFISTALLAAGVASALAASSDETVLLQPWRLESHRGVSIGSRPSASQVQKVLRLSGAVLNSRGVRHTRLMLQGSPYPALKIEADASPNAADLNRMAAQVQSLLPGISLVYAPGDLMGGAEGYFSASDRVLAMSHTMFETSNYDTVFFHEVVHASHFVARLQGGVDPLSAVTAVKSTDPTYWISPKSPAGYTRLQTFEEVEAFAESVAMIGRRLETAVQSSDRAAVANLLNDLKTEVAVGERITDATQEIAARATTALLRQAGVTWQERVDAGSTRSEWNAASALSAYAVGASVREIPASANIRWFAYSAAHQPPKETSADLLEKLQAASELSVSLRTEFRSTSRILENALKLAEIQKPTLVQITQATRQISRILQEWKLRHSHVEIARF